MNYYQNGGYDRVIRDGKENFNVRIKKFDDLDKMHEAELAYLYLMGKSYQAMNQIDNATGCFHIAYSQHGFEKRMLTGPYDFRGFVQKAGKELEAIAGERGEVYVNNFDVNTFFDRELAKSGCFIATATYGSPLSAEVVIFSQFRDETLLTSKLGRRFVAMYYSVSPPLARLIVKSGFLRIIVRELLLAPLLRLLRRVTHVSGIFN